jgi:hypothetical protein
VSLGANDNPDVERLIVEEFIQGVKSGQRTCEELAILANVSTMLESYLLVNENKGFVEMATQTCSELLVHVSE